MKPSPDSVLKDLAKVKALFQARTLELLLKDQPKESPLPVTPSNDTERKPT